MTDQTQNLCMHHVPTLGESLSLEFGAASVPLHLEPVPPLQWPPSSR